MPPGAGSDAFFSFGSDFPQVAQEIIDIARGLRGEVESALGGNNNIGANLFTNFELAANRAAEASVNSIKSAKQEIVEALSSGAALPAGGLLGRINPTEIGQNFASGILNPLRELPQAIQSQILPQVEAALGRLVTLQSGLMSRVVAGSTSEITQAALAAGRGGELRGALGAASPGLAAGQISFGATSSFTRYSAELDDGVRQAAQAAREFATALRENRGRLTPEMWDQLAGTGGASLGGFAFNVPNPQGGHRFGIIDPDTGVPTTFNRGTNATTGNVAAESVTGRAYQQYLQTNAEALQRFTDVLTGVTDRAAMEAEAAARLTAAQDQAAAAMRARGGGGFGSGSGGGPSGGRPPGPSDPLDAFMGSLFGQGWHAMQSFDANKALSNLAGTAGVLLRYGGEARVLFGAIGEVKNAFQGFEQYQVSMVQLQTALDATHASQVDLNDAIDAGAQSGVDQATSIQVGANALEAYSSYIQQGASATDIFTESVKQAGIAAVITGEQAKEASQQLIAATIGFNTGPQGQGRILNAVSNAARNFGGDRGQILQSVAAAAPDAYLNNVTPEELANIAGLIQRSNPTEGASGIASAISKLTVRGQNAQFQQAMLNANALGAGVPFTGDLISQIEKLSRFYNSLTESEQKHFVVQLGGARAIGDMLPLLQHGNELLDANRKSYDNANSAQTDYIRTLNTIGHQITEVGTLIKNLATDVGRSGIFLPFGAALELLKPLLTGLDDLMRRFDDMPLHLGPFIVAFGEILLLYRAINSEAVKTVFGRGGAAASSAATSGEAGTATEAESAALGENDAAKQSNLSLTERVAAANDALAIAVGRETAAEERATAATEARMAALAAFSEREAAAMAAGDLTMGVGAASVLGRAPAEAATGEATALEEDVTAVEAAIKRIEVAFSEGAITFQEASDAITLAIGEGVTGIVAAEDLTVEALVTGAAEIRAAMAATAEMIEAGGGVRGGGGFLSGGALGIGLTAVIGASVIDQAYNSAKGYLKTEGAGEADLGGAGGLGVSSDDLHAQAMKLKQDAKDIGDANGGIMGTLTRGFETLFSGGTNSNTIKGEDIATANRLQAQADALDKLRQQAAGSTNSADVASLLDLTRPGGVADGLKLLASSGRDSRTQVNALVTAINRLGAASGSTASAIGGPLDQQIKATQASNDIVNRFASDANLYREIGSTGGAGGGHDADILNAMGPSLQGTFTSTIQNYFANGGKLNLEGKKKLIALLTAQAEGYKDWGKLTVQDQKNTIADIQEVVNNLFNSVSSDGNLDPTTIRTAIGDAAAAAIQLAPQYGQQVANEAALGADQKGEGAKVAGDRASLGVLTRARTGLEKLIAGGFKDVQDKKTRGDDMKAAQAQLEQLNAAIDGYQVSLNSDLVSNMQLALQLQNAETPQEDKVQIDANTIAGLTAQLNATKNKHDRGAIQAQIDLQNQQQGLDRIAEHYSKAQAQIDPRNQEKLDQAAINHDNAILDYYRSLGDTHSGAFRDAQRQKRDDILKQAQDRTAIVNAQIEANVFPGSQIESARAKVQEATNSLKNDLKGTEQYYRDLGALHQAQVDLANAQVEAQDVARQLTIDLTDPVAVARDAAQKALDQLNKDIAKGAPGDVLNKDRLALMQANNSAESAAFNQRLQDAQTNAELGRTSYAAYISYLESQHNYLVSIQHRTRQQQDELNQVDQALLSVAQAAGGQFNLGQINVPTVYQARRTLAGQNGTGVYDYNPVASGTAFGMGNDPATAAATAVLDPVAQSIHSLSPAATNANRALSTLAATLAVIGALEHGSNTGNTHITINGADMNAVLRAISSAVGAHALSARTPSQTRKGGS